MKIKNTVKKIISLILCAMILLASPLYTAYAEEGEPNEVTFQYWNSVSPRNSTGICYYSDSYFAEPGTAVNPHLRTMSMAMVMSAFESYRDTADYKDRCENFEDLMKKLRYGRLYHNQDFDTKPTDNSIGVAIASKNVVLNNTPYTILVVGIRGAGYEAEWAGNVRIGKSGQAKGFADAKKEVLQCILDYEKTYGINNNAKIWICGYSRSAAVANLAAKSITDVPSLYSTSPDDIYCYTFESPQAEQQKNADGYPNIHNTISPADLVPLIPLSAWDFSRVGSAHKDNPFAYQMDDLLLPAPGTEEYEQHKERMLAALAKINPDMEYIMDNFEAFIMKDFTDIFSSEPLQKDISQSQFVEEFIFWFNYTLPDPSRISYVKNYESAFSTLSSLILGAEYSQKKALTAALKEIPKKPSFYGYLTRLALTVATKSFKTISEYDADIKSCSDDIAKLIVSEMKAQGAGFSDEEYRQMSEALYPAIRFLDGAIYDDVFNNKGYYMITLILNLDQIFQAHDSEIIFAWLQCMDSYYSE